jgi:hypothetical protein
MDANPSRVLGYGFSDQLFLARHADLNQPIYSHRALPSLRYLPSPIAVTFEQRVDFSRRCHKRPHAVPLEIAYEHPFGAPSRSRAMGFCETFNKYRNRRLVPLLRFSPYQAPPLLALTGIKMDTRAGIPTRAPLPTPVFRAQQSSALLNKSSFRRKEPHAPR